MCQEVARARECLCRTAVEQAYNGMIKSGAESYVAIEVAARVYRHHHPEACSTRSRMIVEQWVRQRYLH